MQLKHTCFLTFQPLLQMINCIFNTFRWWFIYADLQPFIPNSGVASVAGTGERGWYIRHMCQSQWGRKMNVLNGKRNNFLPSEIFKLLCQVKQFSINYFDFLLIHTLCQERLWRLLVSGSKTLSTPLMVNDPQPNMISYFCV